MISNECQLISFHLSHCIHCSIWFPTFVTLIHKIGLDNLVKINTEVRQFNVIGNKNIEAKVLFNSQTLTLHACKGT